MIYQEEHEVFDGNFQLNYSFRMMTMEQLEGLYSLKEADKSSEKES